MKLFAYILSIIVVLCLVYVTGFLFFYGMSTEDAMILIMSAIFAGLTYFFCKMTQLEDNEYTRKLIKFINDYLGEEL